MKTLVYLVYGNKRTYQLELTYSVLSASHFLRADPDDIKIVLMTTPPNRRDDLPVEHILIDESEILEWTLNGTFGHAAKYFALVRAMDEFRGAVAFIDTDTYFTRHPKLLFDRVGPGRSVMCDLDKPLGAHGYWLSLLDRINGTPVAGYSVDRASTMHNSGVVGVDWSLRSHIPEMFELMSALHSMQPLFTHEQFAFSAVLERHTSVSVCPDVIRHYWGFDRRFVHAQIEQLFPEYSVQLFERHVGHLRPLGMPEKRLIDRIRARGMGLMRRGSKQYVFAYLSYLSALASKSALMADAWANTALDAIVSEAVVWESSELRHMPHDFRRFRPENLDSLGFLQPETRRRWQAYWATHS